MFYIIYFYMSTDLIWDKLPDCIIDEIYTYIYYKQPTILLNDITNYHFTIDYIKNYIHSYNVHEENILWTIMLHFQKGDNKFINEKFDNICYFVNNTNHLIYRYQGLFYFIKKYIYKMSIDNRKILISLLVL